MYLLFLIMKTKNAFYWQIGWALAIYIYMGNPTQGEGLGYVCECVGSGDW